ncbi:hypothetical protein UMM65_10710 [Aureibaculum sp. 2210JD6-5]|uniref:hypothetical protein n=1 Tax=Aureibaculum sp. 2210JD6-5 TaxID=3103957 RepID=UPI002AAEC13D|nr:hypothetical protein [Aureibaculum sp. 2210JD6-5]MDY7395715.1 hypothetical protein [Aureibaculum sp. 2210JD6-5]
MKTLVIKKIIIIVLILTSIGCLNKKRIYALFKDTYISILSEEIFKFKYLRSPNPEEFERGIKELIPIERDTFEPLNVYVQKGDLEINFSEFNSKLPESFKFVSDSTSKTISYLPENIEHYSNKKYNLISFVNLDKIFEKQKKILNSGGIVQFSKALLNKEQNKALLFIRDTRNKLDSVESLILFNKNNGKWEKFKVIGISLS